MSIIFFFKLFFYRSKTNIEHTKLNTKEAKHTLQLGLSKGRVGLDQICAQPSSDSTRSGG